MIAANELRIGNWVNYIMEDKTMPDTPGPIFLSISGKDAEHYNPIPLSPEVLEKCGFDNQEDGDGGYYHELLSDNGVLFVEGDKKGYTDVFIDCWENIRVRYLHQLQNLYFALTSHELTIKL